MHFRRLYWVTEQFGEDSASVTGVYTSIYDLISNGLRWLPEPSHPTGFRVTLIRLDARSEPLGVWDSSEFDKIVEDVQPYVETGEFAMPDVEALKAALPKHMEEMPEPAESGGDST